MERIWALDGNVRAFSAHVQRLESSIGVQEHVLKTANDEVCRVGQGKEELKVIGNAT